MDTNGHRHRAIASTCTSITWVKIAYYLPLWIDPGNTTWIWMAHRQQLAEMKHDWFSNTSIIQWCSVDDVQREYCRINYYWHITIHPTMQVNSTILSNINQFTSSSNDGSKLQYCNQINYSWYWLHFFNQLQRPFNGLWSGTTRVGRYQKGKTNLDFTGARDSEWQNQIISVKH